MTAKPLTTVDLESEVYSIAMAVDEFLRARGCNITEATAALMLLTAKGAIYGVESDEYLINEFRKCLAAARVAYGPDGTGGNHAIN